MSRVRGVTLLELLVAAVIMAAITAVTTRAIFVGVKSGETITANRDVHLSRVLLEDQLSELIRRAWLAQAVTEQNCFFVGQSGAMTPGDTTVAASGSSSSTSQSPSSSSAGSTNGLSNSGNADNLIFTALGARPRQQFIESTDDWETNNQNFGPQGGVTETCLTMTAIDAPADQQGLFLRTQHPADNDPTQGGFEQLISSDVTAIGFEFYDGSTWQPTWDTRSMTTRRLPAAVRVSYRLTKDTQDHVFVVYLPYSDVTAANPVTQ